MMGVPDETLLVMRLESTSYIALLETAPLLVCITTGQSRQRTLSSAVGRHHFEDFLLQHNSSGALSQDNGLPRHRLGLPPVEERAF